MFDKIFLVQQQMHEIEVMQFVHRHIIFVKLKSDHNVVVCLRTFQMPFQNPLHVVLQTDRSFQSLKMEWSMRPFHWNRCRASACRVGIAIWFSFGTIRFRFHILSHTAKENTLWISRCCNNKAIIYVLEPKNWSHLLLEIASSTSSTVHMPITQSVKRLNEPKSVLNWFIENVCVGLIVDWFVSVLYGLCVL